MFKLDERLQRDTVKVGDFELCRLLIHRDARFPWFILVPRREKVFEIYQLAEDDRIQMLRESCLLAEAMVDVFSPDKINIATLGNQVPQLHQHHIARFVTDAAWPNPVWGSAPEEYDAGQLEQRLEAMVSVLQGDGFTA